MATILNSIVRTGVPTSGDLSSIPLAHSGEFHLSENEVAKARRLIYSINKDKIRQYRTVREGNALYVWRIK